MKREGSRRGMKRGRLQRGVDGSRRFIGVVCGGMMGVEERDG